MFRQDTGCCRADGYLAISCTALCTCVHKRRAVKSRNATVRITLQSLTCHPSATWLELIWALNRCVYTTEYCKKIIRISTDILWRVFHNLTEPVPYTFVSVKRRNNEARAQLQRGPTLHYSVALQIQRYTEPVPLKCFYKTRHKLSVDIQRFFTVKSTSTACAIDVRPQRNR